MKKEIGFNAAQLSQYDTLSNRHKDEIKTQFDKIRTRRSDQFKELVAGKFTDSTINVLSDRSARAQKEMEVLILVHLREIRMLCSPDQLPKFDSVFYKVLSWKREPEKK